MKAFLLSVAGLFGLVTVAARAEPPDYRRDVQPILTRHCVGCHGPEKQRSGLRLDSAAALRRGGNAGEIVVPGKSAASRLVIAVSGGSDDVAVMPPKGERLTEGEVAVVKAWIDAGAPAPADDTVRAAAPRRSQHWAFQPLRRPEPPTAAHPAFVRNPIDRFIVARLEKAGLTPSPEAEKLTLLRRVSLDLTGLPPSLEEVTAFLGDDRPDAYERAVDRLLASPHYGELWGRRWLDQARYADSNGFNIDAPRSIWPYRDWVIAAFNRDLPFDQFTIEQLAGDLLPNATLEQQIATGFHRNTLINQEGGIDLEQFRVEAVVDRVNTTGAVFLGLTLGCCQCHDHKFDPFTQREYYQLFAFFNSQDEPTLEVGTPEQLAKRDQVRKQAAAVQKQLAVFDHITDQGLLAWEKALTDDDKARLPAAVRAALMLPDNGRTPAQVALLRRTYGQTFTATFAAGGLAAPTPFTGLAHLHLAQAKAGLEKRLARLKKTEPEVPTTMVLRERKEPRPTFVHLGGDFLRKGVPVKPDVLAGLHPLSPPSPPPPLPRSGGEGSPLPPAPPPPLPRSGGEGSPLPPAPPLRGRGVGGEGAETLTRLDLARWLTDARNPLTPRVIVNRFWQAYFGVGLVETENDFGTQGTPPTHPDLLDYLATQFVDGGWRMKPIHRLIVTSATYRQASRSRPELAKVDPRNKLLGRQNRLRLEAEAVRDAALTASGLLARKIGGPSVFPPQPDGVYRFTQIPRTWEPSPGADRYRRGMYTYFWRSAPHPGLLVFDAPDSTTTCTRRNRSNTPLQALTLLNDEAFYECARALAARVCRDGGAEPEERVRFAFRVCLGREPTPREAELLGRVAAADDTWVTPARVLLNLDEFITRE